MPHQTAPLLCEVRDGFLVRPADWLDSGKAREVRGVLNVYRESAAPLAAGQIELLQALASNGFAALKAIEERDQVKNELRVASMLSSHLLGRERVIDNLTARLRELEESLSV